MRFNLTVVVHLWLLRKSTEYWLFIYMHACLLSLYRGAQAADPETRPEHQQL